MSPGSALAGRCLMVGLEGSALDRESRSALVRLAPGGVILFRRNLDSPERLAELVSEIEAALPYPLLLALDQEGGRVSRLEPWIGPTPTAAALAGAGEAAAGRFGRATGDALSALGFNVDFAPVVDLCESGIDNAIGDRSFGTATETVSLLAGAFLDGLQAAGVAGCLKHFPGLGRARFDSHVIRPTLDRSLEELETEELVPYRALGSRAAIVMVGHGHYPALDPSTELPATLSRAAIQDLLRGRLGFRGLVASDDMEMGAIQGFEENAQDAVRALEAGCDLLLYCRDLDRAARSLTALTRKAEAEATFAARVEGAVGAVSRAASRWTRRRPDLALWERARQALAESIPLSLGRGVDLPAVETEE